MTQTILIIIGIIIIVLLLTRKGRKTAIGICATAIGMDVKKRDNKEKILVLLEETPSISSGQEGLSNSDIREALGVADRTVIRYMDELEREGKVEQMGNTGRGVAYRLKR